VPQWTNPPLSVYHGTDNRSAGAIGVTSPAPLPAFIPNLALCRPFTDFGQGFYTTTNLHQARQWANTRVLGGPGLGAYAVVLRFDLDRDWLASLDTLAFVRPTADFWSLVTDCRQGFPPHQRQPPAPLPYEVVYGPVTLWPQILVISDCVQVSFHTQNAVAGLGQTYLHDSATYLF
jgi:hypothetical protein